MSQLSAIKEPWQMTQRERYDWWRDSIPAKYRPPLESRPAPEFILEHRQEVLGALALGKPVPASVLKDYPDLAAKIPVPEAEVTPEVTKPTQEIDKIVAVARERRDKSDLALRGLKPSEYDWMTDAERVRLDELTRQLLQVSQVEARARVEAKRLARREAVTPTAPVSPGVTKEPWQMTRSEYYQSRQRKH